MVLFERLGLFGEHTWTLRVFTDRIELSSDGVLQHLTRNGSGLQVRRRWLVRHELVFSAGRATDRYLGLSRPDAASLRVALERFALRAGIASELSAVVDWARRARGRIDRAVRDARWLPEEDIALLEDMRPRVAPQEWFDSDQGAELAAALTDEEHADLKFFAEDFRALIADRNEAILHAELLDRREFFERVENSPLTEEQARAVVCFDNRVSVVAAAGSGKTSVMVGRAAYAIQRGFVRPERILLLAFNKAAAEELQERVEARLDALGLPADGMRASTFHSFGLSLLGQATGRKPRLAPWLDGGGDEREIARIVKQLRQKSPAFRMKWDVFRLLYARAGDDPADDDPGDWDKANRRLGHRTYGGEVVKSEGERLIADFLFLHHVDYHYEHPGNHDRDVQRYQRISRGIALGPPPYWQPRFHRRSQRHAPGRTASSNEPWIDGEIFYLYQQVPHDQAEAPDGRTRPVYFPAIQRQAGSADRKLDSFPIRCGDELRFEGAAEVGQHASFVPMGWDHDRDRHWLPYQPN